MVTQFQSVGRVIRTVRPQFAKKGAEQDDDAEAIVGVRRTDGDHAIEKGHTEVLSVLQEHGIDVHSAIEIPDNAGRTAIFEAIDNHENCDILKLITKSRKEGGFEAKVNILNYNG